MPTHFSLDQIDEVVETIHSRTHQQPRIAIILGSGLNDLADSLQKQEQIPFGELPHFPLSTVKGHAGRMVIGELEGRALLVMQGRLHFYEGYSMAEVPLPIRVMQRLGIGILIVTNAAGGVNPDLSSVDLVP